MRGRLLLTGASGFVAGSVLKQALADWEVCAVSRGPAMMQHPNLRWVEADVCADADAAPRLLDEAAPLAVVHTTAIADIDYCEHHQEEARRVNRDATVWLADACAARGVRLVYCSTDNVFDGERGMYREDELPKPVNYYGVTKAEAESAVLERGGVAARVAIVMGLALLGAGNSFLSRMMKQLEAGETLGVPGTEVRTPVDVVTAGRALIELAGGGHQGVYHLSGNDRLTRLEMVRRIAAHLGYARERVQPNDPTVIPGRAPRPRDVSLDNTRTRAMLATPLCGLEEGISRVLAMVR